MKLYIANCPRCGSSAAGPEQPDHCLYCPAPVDDTEARRRRLMRWLVACMILGGLAVLLG